MVFTYRSTAELPSYLLSNHPFESLCESERSVSKNTWGLLSVHQGSMLSKRVLWGAFGMLFVPAVALVAMAWVLVLSQQHGYCDLSASVRHAACLALCCCFEHHLGDSTQPLSRTAQRRDDVARVYEAWERLVLLRTASLWIQSVKGRSVSVPLWPAGLYSPQQSISPSGSSPDSGFDIEFASLCAFPIFSIDFTVLVSKAQNLSPFPGPPVPLPSVYQKPHPVPPAHCLPPALWSWPPGFLLAPNSFPHSKELSP